MLFIFICISQFQLRPAPHPGLTPEKYFFALDGKLPGAGTLELLSNPPGWERKKRASALSSINTLTSFSLIEQSSSAILSILMCEFLY